MSQYPSWSTVIALLSLMILLYNNARQSVKIVSLESPCWKNVS